MYGNSYLWKSVEWTKRDLWTKRPVLDLKRNLNLPVFEDGVGDVDAHDSVEKKKNQNGKVEPDELVQLPIEEARPKNINYH